MITHIEDGRTIGDIVAANESLQVMLTRCSGHGLVIGSVLDATTLPASASAGDDLADGLPPAVAGWCTPHEMAVLVPRLLDRLVRIGRGPARLCAPCQQELRLIEAPRSDDPVLWDCLIVESRRAVARRATFN